LKVPLNSQTHYTKNNWSNFDNAITMDDKDWGEDDIKEFIRLVKKSEKT
jgi:hypothetical protein